VLQGVAGAAAGRLKFGITAMHLATFFAVVESREFFQYNCSV